MKPTYALGIVSSSPWCAASRQNVLVLPFPWSRIAQCGMHCTKLAGEQNMAKITCSANPAAGFDGLSICLSLEQDWCRLGTVDRPGPRLSSPRHPSELRWREAAHATQVNQTIDQSSQIRIAPHPVSTSSSKIYTGMRVTLLISRNLSCLSVCKCVCIVIDMQPW